MQVFLFLMFSTDCCDPKEIGLRKIKGHKFTRQKKLPVAYLINLMETN